MNEEFNRRVMKVEELFAQLHNSPALPLQPSTLPEKQAIYVFLEDNKPVHVGRTRNLKRRSRGHISNSHFSASFAFKRARVATGNEKASYKAQGSRNSLIKDDTVFFAEFTRQIGLVKNMQIKYLLLDDPIDQYLLELYAAMEYKTSLSEFDTH